MCQELKWKNQLVGKSFREKFSRAQKFFTRRLYSGIDADMMLARLR